MRSIFKTAVGAALLVPLAAVPVDAQSNRWDIGVNGGYSWYSSMVRGADTGLTDGESIRFRDGWLVGAQLGFWFTPQLGLRANATYADRPLVTGTRNFADLTTGQEQLGHVNLWSGSGDLMWRFRAPNATWEGTELLPYVTAGLGAKWINPAGPGVVCTDAASQVDCHPFTVTDGTTPGNAYALREGARLMGLLGIGTDVRFTPGVALRLELNDRIYQPRLHRVTPVAAPPGWAFTDGSNVSRTVHEIGLQAGLHLLMGLAPPPVVAVAPPPPAPLPPPPAAEPPPPPAEEAITVCIIDPSATGGIRMQNAFFLPERGDTLVTVNGQRVPLRTAVPTVRVARDADWYVRGEPLAIQIGTDRVEFLTYQSAMRIPQDRLAFVGTVNGYPVYADRDEVADFMTRLDDARRTYPDRDLGEILATDRALRTSVEGVSFLYVPMDPVGCVFQPVQMMEPVRKGR